MSAPVDRGCVRLQGDGLQLLVSEEYERRVRDAGLDEVAGFDALIGSGAPIAGGRSVHRRLDDAKPAVRIRPCAHGGALSRVMRDRFLGPDRPFRELRRWQTLRARGVGLPTPVLAVSRRQGLFWRSAFGALDCEGTLDADAWLACHPGERERRDACIALARGLRRLHDAGATHGDLHLGNVLIEDGRDERARPDTIRCLLVDLDYARVARSRRGVSPRRRVREWLRLARSLEKRGWSELTGRRYRAIALAAYCGEDRGLRRRMLRWGRMERIAMLRHRLGWWLSRPDRPPSGARPD